jgi:hypothetical protein
LSLLRLNLKFLTSIKTPYRTRHVGPEASQRRRHPHHHRFSLSSVASFGP